MFHNKIMREKEVFDFSYRYLVYLVSFIDNHPDLDLDLSIFGPGFRDSGRPLFLVSYSYYSLVRADYLGPGVTAWVFFIIKAYGTSGNNIFFASIKFIYDGQMHR